MATLSNVLQDISSIVNQDPALPTGTDLSMQVNLANQALNEWGEAYQWAQLRVVGFAPSILLSTTSTALPSNFEKLMSRPFDVTNNTINYEEIRPENRFTKDINERYCYTGGDDAVGHYIVFNPPLASGASINFDFQSVPSSMVTLQDVLVCPSKNFIVHRVIGKIYESRSDPRFQTFKSYADGAMVQLIQEEATVSGAMTNQVPVQDKKFGFRIGQ